MCECPTNKSQLFIVTYTEECHYEEYIEAKTADEAKRVFMNTLLEDPDSLEPQELTITEFDTTPTVMAS